MFQTEEHVYNCVSFSPEKWQLLLKISKELSQHIGAEIESSNESNDIRVTYFTKIKKRKLKFGPRRFNLNKNGISTVFNEVDLNEIVHVERVLFI